MIGEKRMIYNWLFLHEAFACSLADKIKMKSTKIISMQNGGIFFHLKKILCFVMILVPLIVIMGFRYRIGVDYGNYERIFKIITLHNGRANMEWGYYLLNKAIGKLTDNPQAIFLTVAILINILLLKSLIRNGGSIYYGILAYMGFGYYFYAMNIQRQYIAIMIVFYAFPFFEQKELKKFFLFVLIASAFHTSAIIWVLIYLAVHMLGGYYIVSFISVAGITILKNLTLKLLIRVNFYADRIENVQVLIGEGKPSVVNICIAGSFMAVCMVLYRRLILIREGNRIRVRVLWLMLLSQMFLWNFGGAVSRMTAYFGPVYLLLLSDIEKCFPVRWRKLIKIVIAAFLFCFMQIIIHYSGNAAHHFLPYQYRL